MGKLVVSNVSKAYKRYPGKWARVREWLTGKPCHDKTWVLSDINFTINPGEAVGIIGVNGAGKSTLLKIITGTTQPTSGSVHIEGRVAALLELGMGFHPDFTGRQNVFIAGQLLGLRGDEIAACMPAIEAFSEIGDYIDRSVRTYSSGMQMRLAFGVATAVRPDVLIVDEALSVGDTYFQHKCMQRIRSFQVEGTTLLFVSHSPDTVRMLCQRGIMLEHGRVVRIGDAASVMDYYRASQVQRMDSTAEFLSEISEETPVAEGRDSKIVLANKSHGAVFAEITGTNNYIRSGDEIQISISVVFNSNYSDPHIGFGIRTKMGVTVYETNTYTLGFQTRPVVPDEKLTICFSFVCVMAPGTYELVVGVANGGYADGNFENSLFFDQSFMIFEVAMGDVAGWGGLCNLQPKIAIV
ncbi:ABC transporter ATP-binding protein [Simplicispira piscis]